MPLLQPARTLLAALTCPHEKHSHDDDNFACLQLPVFVQPFHGDVTCGEEHPGSREQSPSYQTLSQDHQQLRI